MVILNFASSYFLTFFTQKQLLGVYVLSAMFAGIAFVWLFYFKFKCIYCRCVAALYGILVAVTTYQPLMNVRLLLIGNVKLWHITAVVIILDLMQFRLDNTGGHISHLAGALFGFVYVKLLQNGTDLSKIVSWIIAFFFASSFKKPSTPP
jgi:hypothetical protein